MVCTRVTIDSTAYPEENADADPIVFGEVLFSQELDQGLHTVKLENRENLFSDVDQVSWTTNVGTEDEELIINTYQNLHPSWAYQPEAAWFTSFPDSGSFSGGGSRDTSASAAVAKLTFSGLNHPLLLPTHLSDRPPQINNASTQQFSALRPYPRSKQLLYWAGGLGPGTHTLRVRKDSSISDQILRIDYANVYTTPSLGGSWRLSDATQNPRRSTATGTSKGLIAGIAVISSLAGLALLAFLAFLFIRCRRQQQQQHKTIDSPHVSIVPQSRPHDDMIHPFIAGDASRSPEAPLICRAMSDLKTHFFEVFVPHRNDQNLPHKDRDPLFCAVSVRMPDQSLFVPQMFA
ncbi:hypothetical protein BKA70DRAFT_1481672 [Coprinopsis sp. MPI-PUGE-AT-0042]|nr:hypothetical protein BKA70DRAFT_1481672 [Coprinopsis sp. MPI-PUGE-AT-0042]